MGATDSGAVDGAVKNIQSKSLAKSAAKSGLSGSVGIKGANAPADVWKVSSALTNNGLMEAPQSHADNALFVGITKAQENMGDSLKRDGLVNPGGPTESTFTKYVGQGFMKAPSSEVAPKPSTTGIGQGGGFSDPYAKRKPAEPGTGGLYAPGTVKDVLRRDHAKQEAADQQARIQRQAERRRERQKAEAQKTQAVDGGLANPSIPKPPAIVKPETVKKAVEGLGALANKAVSALTGEGGGSTASNAAKRPVLSDEAYASNRRTADALGKYKGAGDLPRFTSDAINTSGEKAVHEVADMIGQVHARSPEQAQELFDKTAQGIAPENRALLKWAMDGHIADQKSAAQPTVSHDAGNPSAADRSSEQDQANTLIDQVAEKIGLGKEDAQGLKDSFAKGGDQANAVKRFLWENRDAFSDGRADATASPQPGAPGTSQDERGNWFDKNGKPLKNVPNPLLHQTQATGTGWAIGEAGKQIAGAVGEARRDVKEGALQLGAGVGEKVGLDTSSKYLKHFLEGNGEDIEVPRDEARKDPFIRDSEEENRNRFENGTFLGKTGNQQVNDKLLTLKDGQAVDLADHWVVDLPDKNSDYLSQSFETAKRALAHPDRFLATGSLKMNSDSDVVARRDGDTIHIEGTVQHNADDDYDFADNDESFGAYELQQSGRGKPFTVLQNWGQKGNGHCENSRHRRQWQIDPRSATVSVG